MCRLDCNTYTPYYCITKTIKNMELIGLQGGIGSYNDTAIRYYLGTDYSSKKISYLDSTPNVFLALNKNEIECGQFAVYNNKSGLYQESLDSITINTFKVIDIYDIPINHALMVHKNQSLKNISKIITHKEVVKQCRKKINEKYHNLDLEFTSGKLIDPATIASKIVSEDEFFEVCVIGNPLLAEINNLKVIDLDLSNDKDSRSTFFLVKKE